MIIFSLTGAIDLQFFSTIAKPATHLAIQKVCGHQQLQSEIIFFRWQQLKKSNWKNPGSDI